MPPTCVSTSIFMVLSIPFELICDRASGSTSSGGIWLCREGGGGEEQRGHSVATSSGAVGLLGAYLDIVFGRGEC